MDWLATHYASVDCRQKRIDFHIPGKEKFSFIGTPLRQMPKVAAVVHSEDVPVVREFMDVFPDELPGLPPDREIEAFY
jgi:hypothetical protein